MNREQLIRKIEANPHTSKSFDELVKAAGDRSKFENALLTVVAACGQKGPLFPWKDAAAGISGFCERLERVAKEIEEVSQYPFMVVASFLVARERLERRLAACGSVSDPIGAERFAERSWTEAQEHPKESGQLARRLRALKGGLPGASGPPEESRQLARLLREHGRLVKLSYDVTRTVYPRGLDFGTQALVWLCDMVKGSKGERHWAALADVLGAVLMPSIDSTHLRMLYKRNTLSSLEAAIRRRAEKKWRL